MSSTSEFSKISAPRPWAARASPRHRLSGCRCRLRRFFQRAQVQRALQVLGHAIAVQQLYLLAHAAPPGLGFECAQLVHVRGLHGRVQVAALEVAVDVVACHALLDHLVPAPAQVPDEVIDLGTQAVAHLRAHGFVARQAAGDLAAVAPAGTPADAVGFDDGHLQATLGQLHRRGHAGETAADDRHIHLYRALELRVLGVVVEGGAVVGRRALRRSFVQCCIHGCSLLSGDQAWCRYQRQSCSLTSAMNWRYSARLTFRYTPRKSSPSASRAQLECCRASRAVSQSVGRCSVAWA